jgi:4-hydroxy-tetrahydrodipicolinate reductase
VNGVLVTHAIEPLLAEADDGILDFTVPAATVVLAARGAARLVHIIGTTGLSPEHEKVVAAACSTARIIKTGT